MRSLSMGAIGSVPGDAWTRCRSHRRHWLLCEAVVQREKWMADSVCRMAMAGSVVVGRVAESRVLARWQWVECRQSSRWKVVDK